MLLTFSHDVACTVPSRAEPYILFLFDIDLVL